MGAGAKRFKLGGKREVCECVCVRGRKGRRKREEGGEREEIGRADGRLPAAKCQLRASERASVFVLCVRVPVCGVSCAGVCQV